MEGTELLALPWFLKTKRKLHFLGIYYKWYFLNGFHRFIYKCNNLAVLRSILLIPSASRSLMIYLSSPFANFPNAQLKCKAEMTGGRLNFSVGPWKFVCYLSIVIAN